MYGDREQLVTRKGSFPSRLREDAPAYSRGKAPAADLAYSSPAVARLVVMEGSLLDRIEEHMVSLRQKAVRVSQALQRAGVPHAVIGGFAVGSYVARIEPGQAKPTRDLDLLLNESDVEAAQKALQPLGFKYRKVLRIPAFVPIGGKFKDAVHLVWAGQKVRPNDLVEAPALGLTGLQPEDDRIVYLDLANLVKMKLTSFRHKDIVHLQDFLEHGLLTRKMEKTLPGALRERLEQVKRDTERERL